MDLDKLVEKKKLYLKKLYINRLRKRFLETFGKLYSGSSEWSTVILDNHPVEENSSDESKILNDIKEILIWLDKRFDFNNETAKTNNIGVEERIPEFKENVNTVQINDDEVESPIISSVKKSNKLPKIQVKFTGKRSISGSRHVEKVKKPKSLHDSVQNTSLTENVNTVQINDDEVESPIISSVKKSNKLPKIQVKFTGKRSISGSRHVEEMKKPKSSHNSVQNTSITVENKNIDSYGPDVERNSSVPNSMEQVNPDHTNDLKNEVLTNATYIQNSKEELQLLSFVSEGKIFEVHSLLNDGGNPNIVDSAGWTLLHVAVKHGHFRIVQLLIKHGAFLNVPGFEYETPFFTAIKSERFDIAKMLLQNGANPKCMNMYGTTPHLNVDVSSMLSEFKIPSTYYSIKEIAYTWDKVGILLIDISSVIVKQFCALFNAEVIERKLFKNQLKQITHIIVPYKKNRTCEISYEVLMGIANGICIVNALWLVNSFHERELKPCGSYEVSGTTSFALENGPLRSRLSKQNLIPKLFDNINVYIVGNSGWKNLTIDQLKEIVQEFGGTLLNGLPNPEYCASNVTPYHCQDSEEMHNVSTIVLYTDSSKGLIEYNVNHIKVFPMSWFMASVQKYKILHEH